ncbi:MAG: FadR/GntR family transcriptional regulator [Acidimicrobiia bacterium]
MIETIKSMILRSELAPFQRLPSEREMAAMLGVSRPTVRESVRALIVLNILESRHGEGTFVTSLDPELLTQPIDFVLKVDADTIPKLFEARFVLEAGAAALAASRISPGEVEELMDKVRAYERSIDRPEDCIAIDTEFHNDIMRAARSPILASLLNGLGSLMRESRQHTAQERQRRVETVKLLRQIVAALKAGDAEASRAAMTAHLQHVAEAIGSV